MNSMHAPTMSNLLKSYEAEFKTLYESTKLEIQNKPSDATTIRTLETNKSDLLEILEQMNIEVNNSGSSTEEKSKWRSYLRDLKSDLQKNIVDPLNKVVEDANRNVLFNTQTTTAREENNGMSYMDEEQRQQLLDSHHVLSKTNKRLMDAQRVAYDTEQIGSQIMNDLRSQRETLEHTRNHLSQADTYLDKSVRTLRVMSRRLVANKVISYSIIAVLILLILLVLYSKFK